MSVALHAKLEVGQRVEGYCLKQVRGQGEVGTVWEAENAAGEPRALKFIPATDEANRLEVRSIQLTSKLEHRHLLPIEKVGRL